MEKLLETLEKKVQTWRKRHERDLKKRRIIMAIIEYTREARCLDCKYYVPAPKPFAKSMCGLKDKPTDKKSRVCKDWKYKYE